MSEATSDEWVSVPMAAKMLGLQLRTIHVLIDGGRLSAEVTRTTLRPRSRRVIRLRRKDVYDFIELSRVKPGELRGLYAPLMGRQDG